MGTSAFGTSFCIGRNQARTSGFSTRRWCTLAPIPLLPAARGIPAQPLVRNGPEHAASTWRAPRSARKRAPLSLYSARRTDNIFEAIMPDLDALARSAAVVVEGADRDTLIVTGPDRLSW